MKIEIDLNDILGDEYGAETLQDSVRRQVIDGMKAQITKGVGEQINRAIAETIKTQIDVYVTNEMPALLGELIDTEYQPVDRWGERQRDKTTFRKELVKSIHENMQYKKTSYRSEQNAFTNAVDDVIATNVAQFKADFDKQVAQQFTVEAMNYATAALKKKLGIA